MTYDEKKRPLALNLAPSRTRSGGSVSSTSTSSTSSSLAKPPRTPRFAEATAVHSPVEPKSFPFSERNMVAQSQPGDVGFGYIGGGQRESVSMPMTPRSPLKSAMKVPGTPGKGLSNPLSPTFREEEMLEKREKSTEKDQKRDLKIKTRVRMAKFALRSVSFSCSLIILAMISASFAIFNATRALAPMNGLPPWAENTTSWPQKVVLGCACFSLLLCLIVFVGYCRGGHQRAEKVGVYYTMFAVGWFIFSMVMWVVAAALFQHSRNNSQNKDMWGWACVENHRADLFREKVDYQLVCRLQNWTLICIIVELVIEVISIILYSVVFYRYWSKRKLHKSMDMRDKARSDLYLAQLRTQSAPNTPGFGPKSPAFSQYAMSPRFAPANFQNLDGDIEKNASPFTPGGKRLVIPESQFTPKEGGFKLQPAPTKANPATPITPKGGFATPSTETPPPPRINEPAPMAAGEQQYESVPIPGAYAGQAVKSPPPTQTSFHR